MRSKPADIDSLFLEVACKKARISQQEKDELFLVKDTPKEELPLLMGDVQTDLGIGLMERRFSKED